MTREERIEFVSERLKYFIPVIAHDTLEASGAIANVAGEIVDRWETELQSVNAYERTENAKRP